MSNEPQSPNLSRRAVLAGSATLGLAACGQQQVSLHSADAHASDYPTVLAVKHLAERALERSNGRLDIKVFAGGQLGSERDSLELTIFGVLDLNRVNLAPLNAFAPETIVPALPFLFESIDHMRRSLDGAPGQHILQSLTPHGLIGLCFYDSGARNFYNIRGPIYTPDDLRGLKLRVPNSDLYVSMIEALGANPTPMFLGEVYQSLLQGVVDGAENNWPSYESMRHYEAAPYYSLTQHLMTPEILVMSKRSWEKLSASDQELIRELAWESVPVMRTLWDQRVEDSRARVLAAGVQVNEVDDISAFSTIMEGVWDRFLVTDTQQALVRAVRDMGGMA